MAKNKTTQTEASVTDYINSIKDENRRNDISKIIELFTKHTKLEPKMWGEAIVGFGYYEYKYDSGHSGSAPLLGLSSRVNAITLYLSYDFKDRTELLSILGKHKTSKACIYIKKLSDIDQNVLVQMIKNSMKN